MLAKVLLSAFDLLFQKNCLVCQSFSHNDICHRCQLPKGIIRQLDKYSFSEKIQSISPVNNYFSIWEFTGNARDLCLAMKYKPSIKLIKIVSRIAAEVYLTEFGNNDWDYIVPIPSSAEGLKQRGFNHVSLLAQSFRKAAGLEKNIINDCLCVNKRRVAQASLSRVGRISGIKNRFTIKKPERFNAKSILILDDILTTGSTATSAALALRNAGASRIDVLTLCYRPLYSL